MKLTLLALTTATLSLSAQNTKWPPSSTWYSVWHPSWPYSWYYLNEPDNAVTLKYPSDWITSGGYKDQWCNQILTRSVQGDIRRKTISITFTVVIPPNGAGVWHYRGFWDPDVYGTRTVSAGLFLIGYDKLYAQVSSRAPNIPDLTQWGSARVTLPETAGEHTITITAPVTQDNFTNVNGQRSGIDICAGAVKQIGLSLAGGKWYSVGIGSPQPVESTITINSFSVQ